MTNYYNTILFTGGGTLGPVTPLLAVLQELQKQQPDKRFVWVGTANGPERRRLRLFPDVPFATIPVTKLDRFLSFRILLAPFVFLAASLKSFFLLLKYRPRVIVGAGAFTQVPLMWVGWVLRIPSLIHQQDVRVGLANRLCARIAKAITVNFEISTFGVFQDKVKVVGNPVFVPPAKTNANDDANQYKLPPLTPPSKGGDRKVLSSPYEGVAEQRTSGRRPGTEKGGVFFQSSKPLLVVIGGGTGAEQLNRLTFLTADELTKIFNIVLISGGRGIDRDGEKKVPVGLHVIDFVDGTYHLLEKADLVVTRAGMGTLTELASLGKPALIIPVPHSHQEANARYFEEKNAAKVFWCDYDEVKQRAGEFVEVVKTLWYNDSIKNGLISNIRTLYRYDAIKLIVEEINITMSSRAK